MKRLICLLLCFCVLTSPVLALDAVREEKPFSDVQGHWAEKYIDLCYVTGLMEGVSEDVFDTEGKLTVAQCAATAARLHARLTGAAEPSKGEPWYKNYVRYMENLGLAVPADVNAECTRAQFIIMMDLVMAGQKMTEINEINALPDTGDAAVLRFYRAGILTGMDEYGTFKGRLSLTRAECAAMMARIADKNLRLKFRPERTDGSAAMNCLYIPAAETALTVSRYNITAELFTAVLNTQLEVQDAKAQLLTYPEHEKYLQLWLSGTYTTDFKQFLSEFGGTGDYAETDWNAINEETGKSFARTAYDDALQWLAEHAAIRSMAEKYKVELTEDNNKSVASKLDSLEVKNANRKIFIKTMLEDRCLLDALYVKGAPSADEAVSLLAKGGHLCMEYVCFEKYDLLGNRLTDVQTDYVRHGAGLYREELGDMPRHKDFLSQTLSLECAYIEPRISLWTEEDLGKDLWHRLQGLRPMGLSEVIETEDGFYLYLVLSPYAEDYYLDLACKNYGEDQINKAVEAAIASAVTVKSPALEYFDAAEYAEKMY